jgi:hypothetical protein
MAGLLLTGGGNAGVQASASGGSGPATISDRAYGINSGLGTGDGGPKTAGFGTVATGVGGALVLLFLWYSLPR